MSIKRMIFRSAQVLTLGVLFGACYGHTEQAPFKLGVISALSGPLAEYGTAIKNGMELARGDKPELFTGMELKFEDDQYDGKKTISAFNKLREADKVQLIYVWGTGPSQAVAPLAESFNYPLVAVTIDPSSVLGRRWVIRFASYSEQYVLTLLDFLRSRGIKKIGLLRTELGYINSMVDALRLNLRPDESLTEVITLEPGDSDLKPALARLAHKNYDALAVYLMSGQIAQFYRQAAGRHSARLTFGTDFFESRSEIDAAGPGMLGAVFPNNAIEPWFVEEYRRAYGNDVQITFAANAYDFATLAAKLFGSGAGAHLNSSQVRERICSATPQTGASGRFMFRESEKGGQFFEFPLVIRSIEPEGVVSLSQGQSP